jgi:dolichol-phosphate mannosyltransferase
VKIALCMPAYNEADSLPFFLNEIQETFIFHDIRIVVVDDHSPDETSAISADYTKHIFRNTSNLGHGPSYLKALSIAASMDVEIVIATDGDGQCSASDLLSLISHLGDDHPIVVGIRQSRREPIYRRVVTTIVRVLVWVKTKKLFPDPNSPHRAFKIEYLDEYLAYFERKKYVIPNIIGTTNLLERRVNIGITPVEFRDRTAATKTGSTWGPSKFSQIPTKRFVKFCISALREFSGF